MAELAYLGSKQVDLFVLLHITLYSAVHIQEVGLLQLHSDATDGISQKAKWEKLHHSTICGQARQSVNLFDYYPVQSTVPGWQNARKIIPRDWDMSPSYRAQRSIAYPFDGDPVDVGSPFSRSRYPVPRRS